MPVKNFNLYSELIAKYLAGEASAQEQEQLFAWINSNETNRQFFEEVQHTWQLARPAALPPPFRADLETAWAKIDSATSSPPAKKRPAGKTFRIWKKTTARSIAAALLLFIGVGLWWLAQRGEPAPWTTLQTTADEKREATLPDGSQVWLNENTRLSYPANFDERTIRLEGEAFFEVQHNEKKPFLIYCKEATTTVLGTSFNVRAYPKEERIEVTVETGKVALTLTQNDTPPVIVPAGTSGIIFIKEKKVVREQKKIGNATAWKTGRLQFEEEPMKNVIATLERYFATTIKVENELIYQCPYTSSFDQARLDEILLIIGASVGFEASKNADGFVLTGKGCQ
ncbi:MAG TPA: DUF4974 domain-containing protein [Bacteroidetes bacterium]|nr:DUF4974 domain-containing protein [Bacteroidota bacterium]